MNLAKAIAQIEENIADPSSGLSDEIFRFISRLTPLVNVDLLIQDNNNHVLLAWRDDPYAGKGWHIPGGIVRYKECLETRIQQVAETEIGTQIQFNPEPIAINEVICRHHTRGHFISLLYKCSLHSDFIPSNTNLAPTDPGYLLWHNTCPDNLILTHEMYRSYISDGCQ